MVAVIVAAVIVVSVLLGWYWYGRRPNHKHGTGQSHPDIIEIPKTEGSRSAKREDAKTTSNI